MLEPIVVAPVPAGHPYVRRTLPAADDPAAGIVVHLPDPDPDHPHDPTRQAGPRWWPAVKLEPWWVEQSRPHVLHVHFGYDDRSPAQLRALVRACRAVGTALVVTVHDLRNPHHDDPALLEAQLDVLLPAADAVLTLTASAADEVAARWGVRPTVVPHPHLVEPQEAAALRAARRPRAGRPLVVGVAAKGVRRNTDPARVLPGLLDGVRASGDRLRVDLHREVRATPAADRTPAQQALLRWVDDHAREPDVDLVEHDPRDDADLHAYLAGLDLAVLPYTHGTHSGWLEACHDVGTAVLAPGFGHYADQGAEATYPEGADRSVLADRVATTLAALRADERLPGPSPAARVAQRAEVADAHLTAYLSALGRTRPALDHDPREVRRCVSA
ncbi:glycosyltransferase [Nocardioides perillae]|uniref:Glycosyltransferase subfamily 4-like N-terminal domain-containing protein n=1 Tax=Nocardioides perillae TaxID=1119534 RepID=A0A7Y9UL34_9ACTN|nr:glycosyltransferase [Nocardioides perillae]NYG54612.1 hypothetical protein [Nocardioides perillae]